MNRLVKVPRSACLVAPRLPAADWVKLEGFINKPRPGQIVDNRFGFNQPCCIHCGTWVCMTCWDFHRANAAIRGARQHCPRCGGTKGFFLATRHQLRKKHDPLPDTPFIVPRIGG